MFSSFNANKNIIIWKLYLVFGFQFVSDSLPHTSPTSAVGFRTDILGPNINNLKIKFNLKYVQADILDLFDSVQQKFNKALQHCHSSSLCNFFH